MQRNLVYASIAVVDRTPAINIAMIAGRAWSTRDDEALCVDRASDLKFITCVGRSYTIERCCEQHAEYCGIRERQQSKFVIGSPSNPYS